MIFIKKWNLILLLSIAFTAVFAAGLAVRPQITKETAADVTGKCIIVDAGHGEPDGGAVGSKGIAEQAINLNIARYLQAYLEKSGVQVMMTRTGAEGIYDAGLSTVRDKKRSDLYNREKLMNHSNADLFVSIHLNKFTDGRYSGPQVFYSGNRAESERAAKSVQQEMISLLAPPSEREIKKSGDDIYLLRQAKIPAILVECGFLSNAREEELLLNEDYQKKTAQAIYNGLLRYFAET